MHPARSRSPVCIRVSSVGDQVRDLKLHLVDHISLMSQVYQLKHFGISVESFPASYDISDEIECP